MQLTGVPASELVTLNFRETDINELVKLISQITKKTFVVDPRVKGNITVISNEGMNSEQIYQVFLSILSVHGYTAVSSGDVVKIIPDNLAKVENTPVLSANQTVQGNELVTQIVKVEYVSAAQLVPLLRPLLPQESHLVAYPSNNTIILSDRADNVNRIVKLIRRIDQATDERVEIIILQHALAPEIVRILNSLEQKNVNAAAAGGSNNTTSIVADERTNSVLISGDKTTRLRLRTLITHLDTPIENTGNTQVIYLRYAQAKELAEVLKGVKDTLMQQKKTEGQATPVTDNTKISIQPDTTTNSLVITAPMDILRNLQAVIGQLDIRRAQVLVEAVIAEVSADMARELGVEWILDGTPSSVSPIGATNFNNIGSGKGLIDLTASAIQARNSGLTATPNLGAGAFLGIGRFNSDVFNFGVLLRALSADSNTNVLSTPSILTLDNQEAEIVVGQNVPFLTGQYTTTGTTGNISNPFQTIQRQDIGLKLKVKPQINEGSAVKLDIEQEVSSIASTAASFSDIVTNKRSIKTKVMVDNGNMVVLGGLIDEDLQQSTQKVPGLGDIPIIGGLFRSQRTKKVKRNLMVFLHPVILRDAGEISNLSQRKYNDMRSLQLQQKATGVPLMSEEAMPVLTDLEKFIIILPESRRTPKH